MKNLILLLVLASFVSCNNQSAENDRLVATGNTCESLAIEDFRSFLTIQKTTPEADLKTILGKSTGGSYSEDKTTFIYKFEGTKRVPIKVYVNAKSGAIETVFMEILGLKKNFDIDVKKAKSDYPIDDCHSSLFGQQPKEIISLFGQASVDNLKKDNVEADVRVLRYFTKDKQIALTLNFYPSQDNKMSSIVVDWF
ncbi:MAG: hypothetical protein AB8B74_10380 [Crocinitomicaceae bacterium]